MADVDTLKAWAEGHEELCEERTRNINSRFDAMNHKINQIQAVLIGGTGTIIVLLLGIILSLINLQ